MKYLLGKKKQLNLLELALQTLLILSCFVFKSFKWYWGYTTDNSVVTNETSISLVGHFLMRGGVTIIAILLGSMLLNSIICLTSALGNKDDKDGKFHVILPIFSAIFMFICSRTSFGWFNWSNPEGVAIVEVNSFFSIIVVLLSILIIALAVLKRSALVVPKVENQPIVMMKESSNADEIKKYKELLDNGTITQEEFDKKKKQLLNL